MKKVTSLIVLSILVIGWGGTGTFAKRHRLSNPPNQYAVSEKEQFDKSDGELWYPVEEMGRHKGKSGSGAKSESDEFWIGVIKDLFLKWGYDLNQIPKPFGTLESSDNFRIEQPDLLLILENMDPMPQEINDALKKILAQQHATNHGENGTKNGTLNGKNKEDGKVICEENYLIDRIFPKLDYLNKLLNEKFKNVHETIGEENDFDDSSQSESAPNPLQMEKLEEILEALRKESDMERKLEQSLETITINKSSADEQAEAIRTQEGYNEQPTSDEGPLNVLLKEIQMIETQMKEAKEHETDFAPTFQKINADLVSLAQLGSEIRDMDEGTGNEDSEKFSSLTENVGNHVQQKQHEEKLQKANNEIKDARGKESIHKIEAQQKSISELQSKEHQKQLASVDEHKAKLDAIERELAQISEMKQKFAQGQHSNNFYHSRAQDNLGKIDDQMTDLKHNNEMEKINKLMNNGQESAQEVPTYYPRHPPSSSKLNQLKEHRNDDKNKMIISALRGTPEFPSVHRTSKTGTGYNPRENNVYLKRLRQKMVSKKTKRME